MTDERRSVSLQKGRHQYMFQYAEGCESDLLAAFVELAMDPESDFDWFDAAVLSYHMGRQAERHLSLID